MPVHDWTKVEPGIILDFHTVWISEVRNSLNSGVLPPEYYALTEQHAGRIIPDVLALHAAPFVQDTSATPSHGGLALADAPPRIRRKLTLNAVPPTRRRTLAIRHVSGHRLVALIEAVSPSNKDRRDHVEEFAAKVASALALGIHVLVIDLFPPGPYDQNGMHGAIRDLLEEAENLETDDRTTDEPMSLISYVAGQPVVAYFEPLAVGCSLPDMPLFLQVDRYVNVPLEPAYQAAFRGEPLFWRDVLERACWAIEVDPSSSDGSGPELEESPPGMQASNPLVPGGQAARPITARTGREQEDRQPGRPGGGLSA
jgi:hypothetical protein